MTRPHRPDAQRGIGVVVPYDFALDRELWRWAAPEVTLHLTRTPYSPLAVSLGQAATVSDHRDVEQCTRDLLVAEPEVIAYACTSGSFVRGLAGEAALCAAIRAAGAPQAVTTSGALLEAARTLGVRRLAVATPYDVDITAALVAFLAEAGVATEGVAQLGLDRHIWKVPASRTADLVRQAVEEAPDCDGVFVSCTNLATYDLIPRLEAELERPVLTANEVTMWASHARLGLSAVGPEQRLGRALWTRAPDRRSARPTHSHMS